MANEDAVKGSIAAGELSIFLSYLFLAILLTYPLVNHIASSVPMPMYIHDRPWVHYLWKQLWWLWFNKFSLVDLHELPTNVNFIFFPVGIKSSSFFFQCLSPSICFALLLLLVRHVILAGNALLLLSLAASAYAAYLLTRYVLANKPAAYLAGLSFAFCCPQLGNAQGHLIVLASLPFVPLFVLLLIKTATENRQSNSYVLALLCVLLFLSYWYFFVCSALFGLIYLILYPPHWNALKRITLSLAFASLFILPVVIWVLAQQEIAYTAPLSVSQDWSVDLLAFFIPSTDHPFFGGWVQNIRSHFLANPTIQSAYLGYPVVVASLLALFRSDWSKLKVWVLTFFTFSIFALGPKLHILGHSTFYLSGHPRSIPLPLAILHKIPLLNALRDCSMFLAFSTLAISVLAGFGFKAVLLKGKHRKLIFSLLMLVLLFDFSMLPFPTFKVKAPGIYEQIRETGRFGSTLVDVPLNPAMVTYEFYQSIHHKRLLLGGFSRMPEFYYTYGDDLATIEIFKEPKKIMEMVHVNAMQNRSNARWAKNFFNIDTIVLHKNFLSREEFIQLDRFIISNFNVAEMLTDPHSESIGYRLGQMLPEESLDKILIDFGTGPPYRYIKKGWSKAEKWGEGFDVCWSDSSASELFLNLNDSSDYLVSLQVAPFDYPGAPPQTISIYVNEHFTKKLQLALEWKLYDFVIPSTQLISGVNRLKFVYGYVKRPCDVMPNNSDNRELGVAFDFLSLSRHENPQAKSTRND